MWCDASARRLFTATLAALGVGATACAAVRPSTAPEQPAATVAAPLEPASNERTDGRDVPRADLPDLAAVDNARQACAAHDPACAAAQPRPTPPPVPEKRAYEVLLLGEWWFADDVDRWSFKDGLQIPTHRCPRRIEDPKVALHGGYFGGVHIPARFEHGRRVQGRVQFVDLDGPAGDAAGWIDRTREYLAVRAPDVVVVMMAGQARLVDAGGATPEVGSGAWRDEYGRRLGQLIEVLEPERRRVVWLALPEPRSAGDAPARWAAARDAQAEVVALWAPTIEYVDSTPFLVDADGRLPRQARVNNQLRSVFSGSFTSIGSIYVIQHLMTPVLLRVLGKSIEPAPEC